MSGDSLEVDDVAASGDEPESYRALSHWAVISLILGLGSALVLIHPLLAVLPVLAFASGAAALRQISYYWPTYTGRTAALAGIWLALVFSIATPTRLLIWHFRMEAEAIRFGNQFVQLLVDERPIEAHQLSLPINLRMPPDVTMLDAYRADPSRLDGIRSFVAEPAVRTLLGLGQRATARLYEVESLRTNGESAAASLLYAITYDEEGKRRTFFLRLFLIRESRIGERLNWKVHSILGNAYPGQRASDSGDLAL